MLRFSFLSVIKSVKVQHNWGKVVFCIDKIKPHVKIIYKKKTFWKEDRHGRIYRTHPAAESLSGFHSGRKQF